jgi:Tfp pilus assembly protein PilX
MNRSNQKGIALILTLILVLVMSVMAVSLMFLSQTETWSSLNYRLMSQSRDGAEAGINSAANYIVNTYTQPGGLGDPTTAYTNTASPVTYGGNPVYLSTVSTPASNYPVSAVKSAFNTSGVGKGSVTAGNVTINYNTYAQLISMHTAFQPFGSPTNTTIQTWKIVSDGSISTVRAAKVEVSAMLERHITPTFNYAVFATYDQCSALTFGGGGTTNSYDSSTYSGIGLPTFSTTDGNVGTNGNLATNGNPTTINGNLYTPRTGTGSCTNNTNVTAWTDNSGHVNGSIVELPQSITYPTPTIPAAGTIDVSLSGATCPTGASAITGCQTSGNDIYLPPGNYHDISITGQTKLHFSPGVYNINSFSESGNNTGLYIDETGCASPCGVAGFDQTPGTGAVILNVKGNDSSGNPVSAGTNVISLAGNSVQNPSLIPTNFQILYAGVGTISLKGNSNAAGLVFAPNGAFSFNGNNSDWYGAVIGKTMSDMGGVNIHYDRHLEKSGYTIGNWMLDSFTWKKY